MLVKYMYLTMLLNFLPNYICSILHAAIFKFKLLSNQRDLRDSQFKVGVSFTLIHLYFSVLYFGS